MKVILLQDVKGLGKKDSIVEASDGYARNYLLPKGLAVVADSSSLNAVNQKKGAEMVRKQKEKESAKQLAEKLKNITVVITAKAGENGKLFGSITNKDIADKLKKDYKIELDKKKIELNEPIKSIGKYTVDVKVYPEISSQLTVDIKDEKH